MFERNNPVFFMVLKKERGHPAEISLPGPLSITAIKSI
jgi:hypothetical protein